MKIIKRLFGPTEKEVIDAAFLRSAILSGECAKQAELIECYNALLATIDHTQDWWSYAHAKELWHQATLAYNAAAKEADTAREQCNALIGVNPEAQL